MSVSTIEWCQSDRCIPRQCMHGSCCPVLRKNRRVFPLVVTALIVVLVLCAFAQHQNRIEEQLHATFPGHDDLYFSWYVSPDGALLYTPEESQPLIVTLDDVRNKPDQTI